MIAACRRDPVPVPVPVPVPDSGPVAVPETRLLDGAPQLLLGLADSWDATTATLQRYDRDGDTWRAVGAPIPAYLGAAGLAWGIGLHGDAHDPRKSEDDRRSPAGAFPLARAYGRAASSHTALPYAQLTATWRCVDDPASPHYNHVLDARGLTRDWRSAEDMLAYGDAYRWVIEVAHNPESVPAAGSCIFLHVGDAPTAGCTAMARADLETLLAWLAPGAVYVLLPRAEHDAVAASWGIP